MNEGAKCARFKENRLHERLQAAGRKDVGGDPRTHLSESVSWIDDALKANMQKTGF